MTKSARSIMLSKLIAERKAKGLPWGRAASRATALQAVVDNEVNKRIKLFKERARKRIEKALSLV